MPTIAITGASGQLGRLVTQELLDRGLAPTDLVLITRTPDAVADRAADGAAVRAADFADPQTLTAALGDVERLLLISTDILDGRGPLQVGAVQAAAAAGVARIAYTSAGNPVADNPVAVGPSHRATEEAMLASGTGYAILRNALYAEFEIPTYQRAVETGQIVTNYGDGATTFISRADCAAAAAGALLADGDIREIYDITGTRLMTAADKAALASELGDRPVEVVQVDDDALVAGLEAAGIPSAGATTIASFGTAIRQGFLDQCTDAVQRLAGRPPRDVRDVVAPAL